MHFTIDLCDNCSLDLMSVVVVLGWVLQRMTEVYQATENSLQFIIYSQSQKVEEHVNHIHSSHMAHTATPNDTIRVSSK